MKDSNFEKLLNKNVKNVSNILNCKFKNNLLNPKFYYSEFENERSYFGYKYNFISLTINNNEINSITINLNKLINKDFFNSFIKVYGKPNEIRVLKKENIINTVNEKDNNSFNQKLKQSIIETEEGSFDDKPLYILWEKDHYIIKLFQRYDRGYSDITFMKKIY